MTGEVDISNADKLRAAIDFALEQPTEEVRLDLADVAYIDSTVSACSWAPRTMRPITASASAPSTLNRA